MRNVPVILVCDQQTGVNDLGEEIHAIPALGGGRIYVRTRSAVDSFGTARAGTQ